MNMTAETKAAQTVSVLANASALSVAICSEVLGKNELGSYQNMSLQKNQVMALTQTVIEAELMKSMGV